MLDSFEIVKFFGTRQIVFNYKFVNICKKGEQNIFVVFLKIGVF